MAVRSGGNSYRAGDTKPVAPAATFVGLYPKSSDAADPTVSNTQWYFQDPSGAETTLVGVPATSLKSLTITLVAGAATVVFGAAIPGAAGTGYRVGIGKFADENIWIENPASTGFDVRSSDGGSTSRVDLIITLTGAP